MAEWGAVGEERAALPSARTLGPSVVVTLNRLAKLIIDALFGRAAELP